ncbi:hypothetical protein GCM10010466_34090 [Planomonospora alba]|uniref:Uncharacterized protein n=1 Tax=Planomonospora alba TaxID=161354 RepID=A0ABP6NAM4_9ACTN
MLRILFSRLGRPHIGSPQAFSGLIPKIRKSFLPKDREAMQPHIRHLGSPPTDTTYVFDEPTGGLHLAAYVGA